MILSAVVIGFSGQLSGLFIKSDDVAASVVAAITGTARAKKAKNDKEFALND